MKNKSEKGGGKTSRDYLSLLTIKRASRLIRLSQYDLYTHNYPSNKLTISSFLGVNNKQLRIRTPGYLSTSVASDLVNSNYCKLRKLLYCDCSIKKTYLTLD